MNALLESGNLAGVLGLALIIVVGLKVGRSGKRGGWLLALGAFLFLFSLIFTAYIAPALVGPIHLTFTHNMITFVTALPVVTHSLGFILIPFGLVLVALQDGRKAQLDIEPSFAK